MDRRTFMKKAALATAGAAIATPMTAMLSNAASVGLMADGEDQPQRTWPGGKAPKVLLVNGSSRTYGIPFAGHDVSFSVSGNVLTVTEVTAIHS